jgi:hypothetical protein
MRRWNILLAVFLGAAIGCSQTIRNPPMLQNQAELIRSNWENLKIGMSVDEVKKLLGPPTIYRAKPCYCSECAASGPVQQKIEKHWYVYEPVQDPNVLKRGDSDNYFCIYVVFRHGRLLGGRAETLSGAMLLK